MKVRKSAITFSVPLSRALASARNKKEKRNYVTFHIIYTALVVIAVPSEVLDTPNGKGAFSRRCRIRWNSFLSTKGFKHLMRLLSRDAILWPATFSDPVTPQATQAVGAWTPIFDLIRV